MDDRYTPKHDQRAPVRPISFALETFGLLGDLVTLPIRPEDLTRSESSRASVHQTLGRDVTGWVDNFGEGLPTISISGTTGWAFQPALSLDGFGSFDALNNLVAHQYHLAKQAAIDTGRDPADVKLLFIDVLDGFAYSVLPTQFVLRRSKSRPLLYQYNISLQAIGSVDGGIEIFRPNPGSASAGKVSIGGIIGRLKGLIDKIKGFVSSAVSFVKGIIGPIADLAKGFLKLATGIMDQVLSGVRAVTDGVKSIANGIIGIARDVAQAGVNIFRTISAIANIPTDIKAAVAGVASAFNEAFCILKNSLRPKSTYESYEGAYGASNCSSTTGGRPPSTLQGVNTFSAILPDKSAVVPNTTGLNSLSALKNADVVAKPMTLPVMSGHMQNVISGGFI